MPVLASVLGHMLFPLLRNPPLSPVNLLILQPWRLSWRTTSSWKCFLIQFSHHRLNSLSFRGTYDSLEKLINNFLAYSTLNLAQYAAGPPTAQVTWCRDEPSDLSPLLKAGLLEVSSSFHCMEQLSGCLTHRKYSINACWMKRLNKNVMICLKIHLITFILDKPDKSEGNY